MSPTSAPIRLYIERLILDGITLSPHGLAEFQSLLQTELTRLLNERGLSRELRSGRVLATLSAPPIELDPTQLHPATLGLQVARSIHGGIGEELAMKQSARAVNG